MRRKYLQDHVLNNPDLREVDRTRLYSQGMARLQYLTADNKAQIDANREITKDVEKNIYGGGDPNNPAVAMARQRALSIGDTESVMRIDAAVANAQHTAGLNQLPDGVRNQVIGPTPHTSPFMPMIQQQAQKYGLDPILLNRQLYQESGLNPNVGTSSAGAQGIAQFIPGTAQRYGVNVRDPASSIEGAAHYMSDLTKQFGGNTGLALAGYNWGEGNVAKWIASGANPASMPAETRNYVQRITGPPIEAWIRGDKPPVMPAMSSGVGNRPNFSYEDVQRNPFLLSGYFRSLAADPELRVQSARNIAEAAGKALDNGLLPDPANIAQVMQIAQEYPDKLGKVADDLEGRIRGQQIANLPVEQRQGFEDQVKTLIAGPDLHQANLASSALRQFEQSETRMRDHPLAEAANRGWIQPPAPIDPAQPQSIPAALVDRAAKATRVGALNPDRPTPPLLDKDDIPKLQSALTGQAGAQVLSSIQQTMKPEELKMLVDQEPFRNAVVGMSRSGDPTKMNAAYSFMEAQKSANPLEFDRQFPDGLKNLTAWQQDLQFYPPDEAAKRFMRAYDPAQAKALLESNKVAAEALEKVSAAQVISKFSTGLLPSIGIGTAARAPVGPMAGIAAGAMKADYDQNFKDGYSLTGDPTMADKFAMEKLQLKYAVSPTNGNRVMANAPERYYPEVGGSHDWMAQQLDQDIAEATGGAQPGHQFEGERISPKQGPRYVAPGSAVGAREYNAPRALVADRTTEEDIANGRKPSYQVILQDPNGRWNVLQDNLNRTPLRIRFDPTQPFAERAERMEALRNQPQPDAAIIGAVTP
jgi:hypothetical protein